MDGGADAGGVGDGGDLDLAVEDVGDDLHQEGVGAREAAGQHHAIDRHPAWKAGVEDRAGAVGERLGERAVDGGGGRREGEAGEEARGRGRRAAPGFRRTSRARGAAATRGDRGGPRRVPGEVLAGVVG